MTAEEFTMSTNSFPYMDTLYKCWKFGLQLYFFHYGPFMECKNCIFHCTSKYIVINIAVLFCWNTA